MARPRLHALLDRTYEVKLTLVAGPAGFGKTTSLAEWAAHASAERGVAWLSLDERDSDPGTFWTYVISSLRAVTPTVGAAALELLQSARASTDGALESLLNDLNDEDADIVLVLDDYHLIQDGEIHRGMTFLLEHLPANAHVVLATRADPPLPLARMRAQGDLAELRAADLRFTLEEAGRYLRDAMALPLTDADVLALDQRTEGWAAALQLAALSMQGRTDVAQFIATFAGDDRYIVDYLIEEVLQRQPPSLRRFLLETSILNRLTAELCDAVTGEDDGRSSLEDLERQNLFLIPLDDRRRWYRYHHLFADVLRARLRDEHPERVPTLHRRASRWCLEHGELAEAVEHALLARDYEQAAELVERALPAMRRNRQDAELRQWLEALPQELVRSSAPLTVALVGSRMLQADFDGVEAQLQDAERALDRQAQAGTTGEALRTLPSTIAMYRAGLARLRDDHTSTMQHAQRVLELTQDDDHLERGAASALLGLAHWSNGDLQAADRCYTAARDHLAAADHVSDVLGCTLALSDIQIAHGHLDAARTLLHNALRRATEAAPVQRGTADMHVALAALCVERQDLNDALEHLAASDRLGEHAGLPQHAYRRRLVLAQVRLAQHDPDAALSLLDEAAARYDTDYLPSVRPIPAVIARAAVTCGRFDLAEQWVAAADIGPGDDLSYLREYEHLTLARLMLVRARGGDPSAAAELDTFLDRLLNAAEAGERPGSVIDSLVLTALWAHARGHHARATSTLAAAVAVAAPRRYFTTITSHGPAVFDLLRTLPATSDDIYVKRLLAARDGNITPVAIPRQPLADHLSERELEVLHLLASDLDGPQIARHLVVSVHTVRTHTKSIYAKLGVNSRRAAVSRARELSLLSRSAADASL
jgi:LuxR family maltose regulon positive regulatory protein